MELQGSFFEPVNVMHADGFEAKQPPSYFMHKNLVAIAGIGNPERFFNHLSGLGLQFECKAYADHHAFSAQDFVQIADKTILMTEKDAVKCQSIDTKDTWYLPVNALVSSQTRTSLIELILQKLRN
jgi:tetraacyldisaccharide 4'-kinase